MPAPQPSLDADVAIIGSGIAGSMLACGLAKAGMRVLLLDGASHPRFAIGESMILETSEVMRSLADVFDVPELAYFSAERFFPLIGGSHGVKRHFGFAAQRPGQPHDPRDSIQAVIPKEPYGHEVHIYRQDSDAFYANLAVELGATLIENTRVEAADRIEGGMQLQTSNGQYTAKYVVDASGYRSVLAEQHGLRDFDLETQSYGLFTHMVGVKPMPANPRGALPFSMAEGTLHHVFKGGWMWVIPFNNHPDAHNSRVSVGLMRDPRIHPSGDVNPEDDFRAFIAQYPDLKAQFEDASASRPWVKTGRIQYSSHAAAGDRSFLLGHAAGFIDPLFSKGLYVSLLSVLMLGQALVKAFAEDDWRTERFEGIGRATRELIAQNDALVAGAYKSFAHPDVWRRYSVLWLSGAYLELVKLTTLRKSGAICDLDKLEKLQLVGGGYPAFAELSTKMQDTVRRWQPDDQGSTRATLDEMDRLLASADFLPPTHLEIARGATHLPKKKFGPKLLLRKGGLFGQPDYRCHFFGSENVWSLGTFFLKERLRYSALAARHRRAQKARSAI